MSKLCVQKRSGSGFVVSSAGHVVTNYHVIEGATAATVTFHDGDQADVVGFLSVRPKQDIAILVVERGDRSLATIKFAETAPRQGDRTIALGSPLGLSFSATEGIVSALRTELELTPNAPNKRDDGERDIDKDLTWIQTSAPISPGCSGGPLLNERGDVIGVNTLSRIGGQNLNFAVDIRHAKELYGDGTTPIRPLTGLPPPLPAPVIAAPMPAAPPVAGGGTAKERVQQRFAALESIHEQRLVLLAQRDEILKAAFVLRNQLNEAAAEYTALLREAVAVQASIATLAASIEDLKRKRTLSFMDQAAANRYSQLIEQRSTEGRAMSQRYAQLDAQATGVNARVAGIQAQLSEAEARMRSVYAQADQLLMAWLAILNPLADLSNGEHALAIAKFNEWVALDSGNAAAYFARGIAFWRIGQLDSALVDLNRAVQLKDDLQSTALAVRGGLLHVLGRVRDGMEDFGQAQVEQV